MYTNNNFLREAEDELAMWYANNMETLKWYQPTLQSLQVNGKDALDFLHRLTTQDFKNFKVGTQKYVALLRANSQILHLFLAERPHENVFVLWTLPEKVEKLKEDLEKLHFAEDLQFELKSNTKKIHGELSEIERVELGLFDFDKDVTEKNLLLEIPYADFLAMQKGCYPGQEVIERVFTYGKVAKKLVLINKEQVSTSKEVLIDQKKVGHVTSIGKSKAFAYVKKPYYETIK